jgi:type IV fimbrial biogenesis protein FimT
MRPRGQQGFSVIELAIVVAIAAILLAVALPNFRDALARTRIAGTSEELQSAFAQARAEALKLKLPVTICARHNDSSCSTDADWNDGFLMFRDPNGNGLPDAGEDMLLTRTFSLAGVAVASEVTSVSFLGNGRLAGGAARTFEVLGDGCQDGIPRGDDIGKRRQLNLAASGRASGRRLACG